MRFLQRRLKTFQFAVLAGFLVVWCTGCSLADALIDGVFLGISQAVSTALSNAIVG